MDHDISCNLWGREQVYIEKIKDHLSLTKGKLG